MLSPANIRIKPSRENEIVFSTASLIGAVSDFFLHRLANQALHCFNEKKSFLSLNEKNNAITHIYRVDAKKIKISERLSSVTPSASLCLYPAT